ncbi:hypothetical protein F5Y01DRAFT_73554 [Xylaria sp. FL0043]|nr:hypothetical protein F5Y01DRAFT_73554 [Xylaria sp. FL0043]
MLLQQSYVNTRLNQSSFLFSCLFLSTGVHRFGALVASRPVSLHITRLVVYAALIRPNLRRRKPLFLHPPDSILLSEQVIAPPTFVPWLTCYQPRGASWSMVYRLIVSSTKDIVQWTDEMNTSSGLSFSFTRHFGSRTASRYCTLPRSQRPSSPTVLASR